MSAKVRVPAVAGMFYPADPDELRTQIEGFLAEVELRKGPSPKAIIVPHAGTIYSGPIAASAYAQILPAGIERVVLLGPSHRVPLQGLAASSAELWRTPLGDVPLKRPVLSGVEGIDLIPVNDAAHELEHSLEVQLPFLQVILGRDRSPSGPRTVRRTVPTFKLIPLVVGDATQEEVADVLAALWGGPETLIVISSDLSHYMSYRTGRAMDTAASKAIVELDSRGLDFDNACGLVPIAGLLHLARQKGMRAELLDLRSSGDTAGPKDQVVGYGAFGFYE